METQTVIDLGTDGRLVEVVGRIGVAEWINLLRIILTLGLCF